MSRAKAKAVVVIEGGQLQGIIANRPDIEIVIKDFDVESGSDSELATDEFGDQYAPLGGKPDTIDPGLVDRTFAQAKAAWAAEDAKYPPSQKVAG